MAAPEHFSQSLQQDLLTLLCHSDEHGRVIARVLSPNLFEGDYRTIAERAIEYWNQQNKAPRQHTADLLSDILENPADRRANTMRRLLVGMFEIQSEINADFVLKSMSAFMRVQRAKETILHAAELLDARGISALEDVEADLNQFLRERQSLMDPGLRLNEIDRVLAYLDNVQNEFKTGIRELDDGFIVPMRGKLYNWLAPSGYGKCIAKGQLVLLPDGTRKPVEQVVADKDRYVLALDESSKQLVTAEVSDWWDNGVKDCCALTTASGRSITTTPNHKYLTQRGWVEVSKLRVGVDFVAVPKQLPSLGRNAHEPKRMRLLAYLIADGNLRDYETSYTKYYDTILREDFVSCVEHIGDKVTWIANQQSCYVVSTRKAKHHVRTCQTRIWLDELGLNGKKSNAKFIPEFLFNADNEAIREFLMVLFSSDGSIYGKAPMIEYSCASALLVEGIYHLLVRFGIFPRIRYFTADYKGKKLPGYAALYISGAKNILTFLNEIGFIGKKASTAEIYREIAEKSTLGTAYDTPMWTRKYSDSVILDRVKSITPAKRLHTYDLTVKNHHNFIVNDMIAHNTWSLIQCGKTAFVLRKRVLHISYEIEAEEVAQRYYQALFAASKRDDEVEISKLLRKPNSNDIKGITKVTISPPFNFNSAAIKEELQTRVNHFGATRFGNMMIKSFPTRSQSVEQLDAYIEQLIVVEKFIPEMLIVDYPGIMKTDAKNHRISLGRVIEDLRGLARRRNVALVVAHQTSKASVDADMVRATHVSEDWSAVMTSDFIVTYSQTATENQFGLARLYVAKGRSEQDKFGVLITQNYKTGQFVLESMRLPKEYSALMERIGKKMNIREDTDDSGPDDE